MNDTAAPRRSSHIEFPVTYAAVGATADPDLMRFPPGDTTPFESTVRLGSGQERFLTASSLLMTWGAQRGAGLAVLDIVAGDGGKYRGVGFSGDGTPEVAKEAEDQFGPDGEPYLTAGTTARIEWDGGRASRGIRIVYTVDEPRRVGFAWGTADADGVIGEELFTVEHREDDTVWATARGFLEAPDGGLLGVKGRALIRAAIARVREQLAALAPGAAVDTGEQPVVVADGTTGFDAADLGAAAVVTGVPIVGDADGSADATGEPAPETMIVDAIVEEPAAARSGEAEAVEADAAEADGADLDGTAVGGAAVDGGTDVDGSESADGGPAAGTATEQDA